MKPASFRCLHCGGPRSHEVGLRKLCLRCYRDLAIRSRYGLVTYRDLDGEGPAHGTDRITVPSGPAKVELLRARASAGVALWREDDVRPNLT